MIFTLSKGLSKVFTSTTVGKNELSDAQPFLWSNSYIHKWLLEKPLLVLSFEGWILGSWESQEANTAEAKTARQNNQNLLFQWRAGTWHPRTPGGRVQTPGRSLDLFIKKSLEYQMPAGAGSLDFLKMAVGKEPTSAGLEWRAFGAGEMQAKGLGAAATFCGQACS